MRIKLSRDTIKYLAMLTMLLNHISHVFYGHSAQPAAILLQDIGYFTAPVMCYFMAEGYRYTRSKKQYAIRLAVFAALSQFPFYWTFAVKSHLPGVELNMMYTLLLGFGMLVAEERITDLNKKHMAMAALLLMSIPGDWSVFAPLFVLLFYRCGNDAEKVKSTFRVYALGFAFGIFVSDLGEFGLKASCLDAAGSFLAVCLAGYVICHFYSGRPAKRGRTFSKWFFYCFYPLHILALGLLKTSLTG